MCICCCSVAKMYLSICDTMDCSMAGFSVLHPLLEFAQTHVRWVSDAIQPSHLLSPLSSCPQSFPASEFFSWVGSLHMQHIFCMWHWRKLFFLFGSQFSKTVEMVFLILYAILIYWKIFEFLSSFSGHYDSNIYIKILNFGLMGYLF